MIYNDPYIYISYIYDARVGLGSPPDFPVELMGLPGDAQGLPLEVSAQVGGWPGAALGLLSCESARGG